MAAPTGPRQLQEEAFAQAMAKYETGLSTFREVLEAQRDLDDARASYLDAVLEREQSRIELGRISGNLFATHGLTWEDVIEPPQ